jgi:hypothetical protein
VRWSASVLRRRVRLVQRRRDVHPSSAHHALLQERPAYGIQTIRLARGGGDG